MDNAGKSGRVGGHGGSAAAAAGESLPDCPGGFRLPGARGYLWHDGLATGEAIP